MKDGQVPEYSRSPFAAGWTGGMTSHIKWWWGKRMTTPNQLGHVGDVWDLNSQPCVSCGYEPNVLPTAAVMSPMSYPLHHSDIH